MSMYSSLSLPIADILPVAREWIPSGLPIPAYLDRVARDFWMRGGYPDASVPPPAAVLPPNLHGISATPPVTPLHTSAITDPLRWPASWVSDTTDRLALHAAHAATLADYQDGTAPPVYVSSSGTIYPSNLHQLPQGPNSFMASAPPSESNPRVVSFCLAHRPTGPAYSNSPPSWSTLRRRKQPSAILRSITQATVSAHATFE
jgi:hypothetical protein